MTHKEIPPGERNEIKAGDRVRLYSMDGVYEFNVHSVNGELIRIQKSPEEWTFYHFKILWKLEPVEPLRVRLCLDCIKAGDETAVGFVTALGFRVDCRDRRHTPAWFRQEVGDE